MKMLNSINGLLLMCSEFDDETNSIINIFDTFFPSSSQEYSFSVLLQIMQYNQNKKHEQYYAYTFIADKEESIFLSLARFPLEHHDVRQRYIINCKNIIFPKKGDYAIETYVSKELLDLEDKNTYYLLKKESFLLDRFSFIVQ